MSMFNSIQVFFVTAFKYHSLNDVISGVSVQNSFLIHSLSASISAITSFNLKTTHVTNILLSYVNYVFSTTVIHILNSQMNTRL